MRIYQSSKKCDGTVMRCRNAERILQEIGFNDRKLGKDHPFILKILFSRTYSNGIKRVD